MGGDLATIEWDHVAAPIVGPKGQVTEYHDYVSMNGGIASLSGSSSKATTTNPKDLLGDKKVMLDVISPFAEAHESFAMMDGHYKYGPFNWRAKEVRARVYVAACLRHLKAWFEGQEEASDSTAHHLGHARACLGILLDAQETRNLIDDRPKNAKDLEAYSRLMEELTKKVEAKMPEWKAKEAARQTDHASH